MTRIAWLTERTAEIGLRSGKIEGSAALGRQRVRVRRFCGGPFAGSRAVSEACEDGHFALAILGIGDGFELGGLRLADLMLRELAGVAGISWG